MSDLHEISQMSIVDPEDFDLFEAEKSGKENNILQWGQDGRDYGAYMICAYSEMSSRTNVITTTRELFTRKQNRADNRKVFQISSTIHSRGTKIRFLGSH